MAVKVKRFFGSRIVGTALGLRFGAVGRWAPGFAGFAICFGRGGKGGKGGDEFRGSGSKSC